MNHPARTVVCAHADAENTGLACEHLLKKATDEYYTSSEHFGYFTGNAAEFVLLCGDCAKVPANSKTHWRTICDSCVQDIACGTRLGELGSPEIRSRESGIRLVHRNLASPPTPIVAASPRGNGADGGWLLLTADCELVILKTTQNSGVFDAIPIAINLDRDQPLSLEVSDDGLFAVVTNTFDRRGIVVDLEQQRVSMELLRGDYLNEHCRFPIAFVAHDGKQLLVHATDWNRLDVSDPSTGRLLTAREPTAYRERDQRPPHYLDYFQCGLSVSPDSQWIAGNGWVWHPVGLVTTWNVRKWLSENVWESEDGPSKKSLCWRDYYWDGPLCWIDERTLAIWGLGDDDLLLIPGVRIFNAETGKEVSSFAGPVGGSKTTAIRVKGKEQNFSRAAGSLVFDQWLFSWMEGKPFSVWDVRDGARLLEDMELTPVGYHRGSREFLSILSDGMLRLTRVADPE